MKSKLTAEEREVRNAMQNRARVQRFRNLHQGEFKTFKAELKAELYDKIDTKLKEDNVTKKQFLENAIDDYMKKSEE